MGTLERLHTLRVAKERLREVELTRAQRGVADVEAAVQRLNKGRTDAVEDGRKGLLRGDWERWWLSESSEALAERAEAELRVLLVDRVDALGKARQALFEARKEAEQARLLTQEARDVERVLRERSGQAASDDRFAARAHWSDRRMARQIVAGP